MIKFVKIPLELSMPEKQVKQYGGLENTKELLYNIIERYGHPEYFDPELVEELLREKK